ncbi:transmembrane protein 126A isoform X2 [Tachyglossus aculeatus]|nr:transmembrane protein 126A isoform X2 [Tachyglossus aculeatus]
MAILPFLTTTTTYQTFVTDPLNSGDLNCETCTTIRSGLVGMLIGGLYPVVLAFPINGALATIYHTSPLPQRGNILNYWITLSRPIFRKMLFPILLQTAFAFYLGSRQYRIFIKALQLPDPEVDKKKSH